VKFTDPEKFRTFEASLLRAQNPAARLPATTAPVETRSAPSAAATRAAPVPAPSGMPGWVWLAGLAAIGFVVWRMFARGRAGSVAGGAMAPGAGHGTGMQSGVAGGAPYGGAAIPGAPNAPYGPGYAAQRPGSGMLGVGLGAAGGLAAGMLAERMLNSRREGGGDPLSASPGLFDAPQGGSAADDLDQRPIDFGTGGSDWDSGSSDVGGADAGGWD